MIAPAHETVDLHPNQVAERLTGRDYVSYSAISTYAACPLRYFFRYVQGLPEETVSSSLVFGRAMHVVFECTFNSRLSGTEEPSTEALLAVFWDAWRSAAEEASIEFGKGEDEQSVSELAGRVIEAFQQSDLFRPEGRVIGVEEELRGPIAAGVPDLLARIDLLIETDRELIIRDFKTSRSRWNAGQAEANGQQLLLYSELARQLAPDKSLRLEFAVVTKTKSPLVELHPVTYDPQRIARTKKTIERVWRAIEAGHFYPAPSFACGMCPFRKPCGRWPHFS